MVSFDAEWLVESLDTISTTISKEWIALVMLPAISSIAGMILTSGHVALCLYRISFQNVSLRSTCP